MEPILTIDNLNSFGGNMLRQGDKSQLKYRLRDVGNKNLGISSKSCEIKMYGGNYTTVVYETTATVSSDDTVSFTIDKVLPKGTFYLEFTVGSYIFPTDHREFFEITPSGKGIEANVIEIVGVDTVVRKAVDLINDDPSLIIDEDKLVTDIISNTGIDSIEEYHQQFTDVLKELSEEKDYHSLPEIAGARGGFGTLGERLNDTTAQLAQKTTKGEVNINHFDEPTRQTFLEAQGIDVNYVLGAGNVKPINMSIFRIAGNLFNPDDTTAEKLINSSGNLVTSVNYNASDFIQVMVGRNYTLRNIRNFAKYDAEGNFVEFVDLVAGSNVSTQFMDYPLIRTSVHENYLNSARIEEGEAISDEGPLRSIIPSDFIEKENYPAFVRYKDGVLPYITDRIYSAIRSISLQGFEIDKTYKLRYIARNNSTNGYRFIVAELNEDGTWSDYFDSGTISVSENTGRLTTVAADDNGKSVIMKVAYDLIPNNYADHLEGGGWATTDPFCVINSSGMGGGGSSFNQSLNTDDSPTFAEVITTGVLPTGTLASPPTGLLTGDTWADTTDSATNPILRVKL